MKKMRKLLQKHVLPGTLAAFFLFTCIPVAVQAVDTPVVTLTDSDAAHVYFYRSLGSGADTMEFKVSGITAATSVTAELGRLAGGTFTPVDEMYNDGGYGYWEEFDGTPSGSDWDFSFAIPDAGFNNDNCPLAVHISVYSDAALTLSFDTLLSVSGTPSDDDLAFVNLNFSKDGIEVYPSFDTEGLNLRAVNAADPLEFDVYGVGSITFAADALDPVDLLAVGDDYEQVLNDLGSLLRMEEGFSDTASYIEAEVDTGALEFLAGKAADIEVYNVSAYFTGLDNLATAFDDVSVTDNAGDAVSEADLSNYIDLASLAYDDVMDTLTFSVNHFTSYCLSQNLSAQTLTVGAEETYPTIQSAVNAALPGDTILVDAGTYNENVTINTPNITVRSVDGAATTTVTGAASSVEVFAIYQPDVTIEGFTILANGADGI